MQKLQKRKKTSNVKVYPLLNWEKCGNYTLRNFSMIFQKKKSKKKHDDFSIFLLDSYQTKAPENFSIRQKKIK